jgi:hypothetical protein
MSVELERKQELQRRVNAYHRLTASADFKSVLEDLKEAFGMDQPAFLPLDGKPTVYDSHYAAIRDGQRSVLLHIEARLRVKPKGDNEVSVKKKVIK